MNLRAQWWPVALSDELRNAPLACQVLHQPLVLFRAEDGRAAALPDRCPHRFAPLSAGKVVDGQIECPYHGWRFAADGRCTKVPGTDPKPCTEPLLGSLPSWEAHGLVWVSLDVEGPRAKPVAPTTCQRRLDTFWITDQVKCTLQDAVENFLDGFHTHFVHAGWVRDDNRRQKISALVRPLADGVEAVYSEESKQTGLISRMLEGQRGISMGRFRLPGLAEIEYRDRNGNLSLLVTAWMTPSGDGQLLLFARVATVRGWLPAILKRWVLRTLFRQVLRQDRRILERISANQERFETTPTATLNGPQDLLGPSIRRLLEHGQPLIFEARQIDIWL